MNYEYKSSIRNNYFYNQYLIDIFGDRSETEIMKRKISGKPKNKEDGTSNNVGEELLTDGNEETTVNNENEAMGENEVIPDTDAPPKKRKDSVQFGNIF